MRDERDTAADGGVPDAPDDDSASGAGESPEPAGSPEPEESLEPTEPLVCAEDDAQPPVVRRPSQLSREERAFLDRFRQDMPPHHDSSWG